MVYYGHGQSRGVVLKVLLSEVGDLTVLEVEFVHKGLAIEEVIERFISDLKKPRSQTEKTPLQK